MKVRLLHLLFSVFARWICLIDIFWQSTDIFCNYAQQIETLIYNIAQHTAFRKGFDFFFLFAKTPMWWEKQKQEVKHNAMCQNTPSVSTGRGVKMIVAKKLRQQCQIFNIAIFPSRCLLRAVVEFGLTSNSNCQEGGEQQDLTQIMLPFQQKLKRVWSTLHRSHSICIRTVSS